MNQQVTIRLPRELSEAMDLRARLVGQAQNAEYVRAVRAYLGDDGEVVTVDCPAASVHGWVSRDDVVAAQVSPVQIGMRTAGGRPDGFVVRGRVVSIDRQWFVSDEAFAHMRARLEAVGVPLIAESEAWWASTRTMLPILTFGWPGPPPRRVTTRELRLGRDAVLDYLIQVDAGDAKRGCRASVSPEAWFRILAELSPSVAPSWPDTAALRGADRLAARAFVDVVTEESDAGATEIVVRSSDGDLIERICRRGRQLRGEDVGPAA